MEHDLNEREKEILKYVINDFILNATPVASRQIVKDHDLGLSPATIRNTLADLEDMGYVTHPHTSAGRIPTDKGYRFYVDSLMDIQQLSKQEKGGIKKVFETVLQPDELFRQTAKILGMISHQLSVVSAPHLKTSILERIELISVGSNRLLVVLTIKSGIVKTITMDIQSELTQESLTNVTRLLNQRLGGLTLETIRETFVDRVRDFQYEHPALINVFIQSADKIFDDAAEREKLHIGGTHFLIEQPEFDKPENIRTMIELINNEGVLIQVLDSYEALTEDKGVVVSIGGEQGDETLKDYSVIISTYHAGSVKGSIAIIGPKRMNYSKVVPLVNYISGEVSTILG
ncbi:MAG: heat-inducible transcriptional repressor HrcA [Bacteroidota bacterium]